MSDSFPRFPALALALPLFVACGGNDKMSGAAAAKLPGGAHAATLSHEPCNESGNRVETLDTNGDGKIDIRNVFDKSNGKLICRISDLSFDGKPDMYEYFDASGNARRREYCYDETGAVNAVEYFEGGRLTRREYDIGGQHKIDTWDYFDPGLATDPQTGRPVHPSRRERDTVGDGRAHQWWTWNGDQVTIADDHDGDGRPDPATAVTLGKNGEVVDNSGNGSTPAPAAADAGAATDAGAAAAAAPDAAPAPAASAGSDDISVTPGAAPASSSTPAAKAPSKGKKKP